LEDFLKRTPENRNSPSALSGRHVLANFSALSNLNKPLILKVSQGDYLQATENIVLLGDSGTGKTHLAIALEMEACTQGKRVAFYTTAELVNLLLEAQAQYRQSRVENQLDC
jgi:DNA replication protein DnaC